MPADFLRDVVRPPAARRASVWSLIPLSIAAHAALAVMMFIIPLAAEIEPPVPASPSRTFHVMNARPIPPPPHAPHKAQPGTVRRVRAAPIEAPSSIAKEIPIDTVVDEAAALPSGPGVVGGVSGGLVPELPPPVAPVVQPPAQASLPRRPGGQIREPEKVVHVPPVYPPIAISAGVQGVVLLEAIIREDGTVQNVRILRSHPLLESAAVDAVRKWRYTPTRLNGVPVPIIMTVTVNFTLRR